MKKFTLRKGALSLLLLTMISTSRLFAQTATISPANANIGVNQSQFFTVTTSGFGGDNNDRDFTYTISGPGATIPASPVTYSCSSGCNSESHGFQFTTAGTYTISVTVTQTQGGSAVASTSTTLTVWTPNLYSTSGSGAIRNWNVNPVTGDVLNGGELFTPSVSTAALAKSMPTPSDPAGSLYYLENTNYSNTGVVTMYAAAPNGTGETQVAAVDINGSSNTGLGFVRLGFDAAGTGWILAGDGSSILYLAKFTGNGTSPAVVTTLGTVTISGTGSASEFQNGDLAISGSGAMYVVANVNGGDTYVYAMNNMSGPTYSLARKWKLVQPGGSNFTGSVNGVAFTQSGSLHISTSDGLYFIDQATANIVSGTVECALAFSQTGLTDLASDKFPMQTTLPAKLLSFTASLKNDVTSLVWESENEQNFSHYEIERKGGSGSSFEKIGTKDALNSTNKNAYSYSDNVSAVTDNALYYRLKMVDEDGTYLYSQTVMVRKDGKALQGVKISPNPANGASDVTVRFDAPAAAMVNIRVVDMSGRILLEQQNRASAGTNSVTINNIRSLQPGMYLVQLKNGEQLETTKLVISR